MEGTTLGAVTPVEDLDPGYTYEEEMSWLDKMIAKFMAKIAKLLLKFGIKLGF